MLRSSLGCARSIGRSTWRSNTVTLSRSLPNPVFDRILMNPPFTHGADIPHILHARKFLTPGGRLVAICAAGPKQQAALQPLAVAWIDLPAGSFASEGTTVTTAIVVLDAA